jgi:hypothetical protein
MPQHMMMMALLCGIRAAWVLLCGMVLLSYVQLALPDSQPDSVSSV